MTRPSSVRAGWENTAAERLRRIVEEHTPERGAEASRERRSLEEIGRMELQKQRSPEVEHEQSRKQRDTDHGLER